MRLPHTSNDTNRLLLKIQKEKADFESRNSNNSEETLINKIDETFTIVNELNRLNENIENNLLSLNNFVDDIVPKMKQYEAIIQAKEEINRLIIIKKHLMEIENDETCYNNKNVYLLYSFVF